MILCCSFKFPGQEGQSKDHQKIPKKEIQYSGPIPISTLKAQMVKNLHFKNDLSHSGQLLVMWPAKTHLQNFHNHTLIVGDVNSLKDFAIFPPAKFPNKLIIILITANSEKENRL